MPFEQAKIDSTLRVEPKSIRFPLVSEGFHMPLVFCWLIIPLAM